MSAALTNYKIAVLFNTNYAYGREIIEGISSYVASRKMSWSMFLSYEFKGHLDSTDALNCDGILLDFEDRKLRPLVADCRLPLVCVGSSYEDEANYPKRVPFVATDNAGLIEIAYDHLVSAGLSSFAFFSIPLDPEYHWSMQRENAFRRLMERDKLPVHIYSEASDLPMSSDTANDQLIAWIQSLPKPIGIICTIDGRAKQLLQACDLAGIAVPEQVAVVGIDNDAITRGLNRIPLTSVMQNTFEMGHTAARLLHEKLRGIHKNERIVIPPKGINVQASSQHVLLKNPHVMRARHFIRQYACLGIKTQQVADYVGVSRSSIENFYKRELGYSVHEEILRFKLDAAKSILENEKANLAEVAAACGFANEQYMHNVFKRELGCSPRTYQQRLLSSKNESSTLLN
jgi:LacI family transcriptional regulator